MMVSKGKSPRDGVIWFCGHACGNSGRSVPASNRRTGAGSQGRPVEWMEPLGLMEPLELMEPIGLMEPFAYTACKPVRYTDGHAGDGANRSRRTCRGR